MRRAALGLLMCGIVVGCAQPGSQPSVTSPGGAEVQQPATVVSVGGTAWRLVRFQGGDGAVLTPDDRTKYTITFAADGNVIVRFDCNRGRGRWTSPGPHQIELGPLALTRAMCPPGSLHDHLVKQWPFVRSYTVKDGHLFLALMADGGTYEFEPVP